MISRTEEVRSNTLSLASWLPYLRDEEHLVLLDSAQTKTGRYSFLGIHPLKLIDPSKEVFSELRSLLEQKTLAGPAPFTRGVMGYLGYELLHQLENVPRIARDDFRVPEAFLMLCGTVWAHDAHENRLWLTVTAPDETTLNAQWAKNLALLGRVAPVDSVDAAAKALALRQSFGRLTESLLPHFNLRPTVSRAVYLQTVETAKTHIFEGDIFEVCTAQRFESFANKDGVKLYAILREASPAAFSAFIRMGETEILSSSPERFIQLSPDGWAQTRPIKGTRPRGKTPLEDEAFRQELAKSPKDLAENMMIVDLCRNDFGRVCEFGSISVPQLQAVETHAFTHQMVSTILGKLSEGNDAVSLLRAAFPGGSVTGAPKIEAMKIINRLEPVRRGVFCGSIGYFGLDGAMDTNIAIRTMVKKGNRVIFHVGGAITADSIAEEEYQETLDKAFGMAIALKLLNEEAP